MRNILGDGPPLWSATAGDHSPFDERVGRAAALMWCREATWPAIARIDQGLNLGNGGDLINGDMRIRVAIAEFADLMDSYRNHRHTDAAAADALSKAARGRVVQLAKVDEHLVFLPLLAAIAVHARRDHRLACMRAAADELTVLDRARHWRGVLGQPDDATLCTSG